jgi:hypothetical protein
MTAVGTDWLDSFTNFVSLSTNFSEVLKEDQKNGFPQIITGDESCFYFDYLRQSVWVASRDEDPETIKQKIMRTSP